MNDQPSRESREFTSENRNFSVVVLRRSFGIVPDPVQETRARAFLSMFSIKPRFLFALPFGRNHVHPYTLRTSEMGKVTRFEKLERENCVVGEKELRGVLL